MILSLQTLSLTDDTVLEEHNEDPALIQMRLLDDGGKKIILHFTVHLTLYQLEISLIFWVLL